MSEVLFIRCKCGHNIKAPQIVLYDGKVISPIVHCKRCNERYVMKNNPRSGRTFAQFEKVSSVDIDEVKQLLNG